MACLLLWHMHPRPSLRLFWMPPFLSHYRVTLILHPLSLCRPMSSCHRCPYLMVTAQKWEPHRHIVTLPLKATHLLRDTPHLKATPPHRGMLDTAIPHAPECPALRLTFLSLLTDIELVVSNQTGQTVFLFLKLWNGKFSCGSEQNSEIERNAFIQLV